MSRTKSNHESFERPAEVISINQQHYKDDDHEVIDIRNLLNVVWRSRWLIMAVALICAGLAALAASRLTPSYSASATVMFGEQRANIADIQDLFSERTIKSGELENEIQILTSSNLLTRVAQELDLQNDPFFNPDLETAEEGGLPAPLRRFIATLKGLLAPAESEAAADPAAAEDQGVVNAVAQIRDGLKLTPVADSTVIQIAFAAPSPDTAARVANAVVEQYIVDQLQVRLDSARAATGWLTTRVEELRQKVQTSEEAVETLRAQLSATAGQSLEITQQQLAALNDELSKARGAAATAEASYARLSEALASGKDLSSESPLIRSYRDEEAALLARRNTLSANHPALPQLDVQIRAVRDRIQDEARRVAAAAEVELETAGARVGELERTVRDLESRVLAQSRDEIRIRQAEREAQANRLLYENLLSRLTETSEQDGLQSADARILSAAEVPAQPVSRHAPQIVLLAGLLGAFAAMGFAMVKENLNNTFRTPRQIEETTGLAVLAALPALRMGRRDRDLIGHLLRKPGSSLAEAIRNLRTSILLPNAKNPPKVVMFTSSVPGEGKSMTSMLTAITSRQMGKTAIIVDCDLRLSSIERILGVKGDRPGILSVLDGSAALEEALHEDPATGLHVLMARQGELAAKKGGNAADILASQRFADLLRALSQRYDVVILDTPPALVVTDARIVSSLADAVVYMVRWGATPRDAVVEGLNEMRSVRAPLVGAVLSMIDEKRASSSVVDGYTHHRARHRAYFES